MDFVAALIEVVGNTRDGLLFPTWLQILIKYLDEFQRAVSSLCSEGPFWIHRREVMWT